MHGAPEQRLGEWGVDWGRMRWAPSADPSLLPPTSAATAVNRLKNLVGAGSGRASGVDTDEEMATAAARTTISGE